MRVTSSISCAGLVFLAVLSLHAPVWAVIAAMVVTGPGIGGCFIGSMMGSQNALGSQDIGSGTGALLVLRSVGGASGSTVAGAIIASGLLAVQRVSGGGGPAAPAHLGWSFAMVYATAAVFA